ncbi:MAG: Gfo/Idh/MocA family oxidoreductase [Rhizobiaceae bacterium]|nr:Gfo/Idh/MocA family oxidoreductase [Rhizobiaceae bacterium]
MLKGALIGCGFFAINQLNAWRDIENGGGARIVAVCDRDPSRLKAASEQFGIHRTYTDAAEMLDAENLDFVDIATTAPSHRMLVELAASHGLPVICQKPVAPTLDDAKAMVAACQAADVPFMIHENFRFQSAVIAVREAIDRGEIGRPFWGRISFRAGYDVFAGQPYLAEGERFIIEDLGVHILDISRFLFNDVASVTAKTQKVNPRVRGEDVATMLLTHESGAISLVDCSFWSKRDKEQFPQTLIEIDGSEGSLRLEIDYRLIVSGPGGTRVRDVSPPVLPWAQKPWNNIQESVLLIQKHWVECLLRGVEPATSGRDNLATYALVEASYQSAATGRPVDPRTL